MSTVDWRNFRLMKTVELCYFELYFQVLTNMNLCFKNVLLQEQSLVYIYRLCS
jgi:hypothetical protein